MDPTLTLALACLTFLVLHVLPSSPLRPMLVGALGTGPYLGLFSLASLAAIVWMTSAYFAAPAAAPLWKPLRHLPAAVMPLTLILLAGGFTAPNPTAVAAEKLLRREDPARGVLRITRHPVMWAIMLWAVTHLLARAQLKGVLFFGSFLVLAAAGTVLLDARKARSGGEDWKRFAALTSNLPFVAISQGRNRFRIRELVLPAVIGLVAFAALMHFHTSIIGLRPY